MKATRVDECSPTNASNNNSDKEVKGLAMHTGQYQKQVNAVRQSQQNDRSSRLSMAM